jgi:anti-sigma regulatory factor (Ser/Thr protein kinase)/serine/threonine protein phosphatase PrpC
MAQELTLPKAPSLVTIAITAAAEIQRASKKAREFSGLIGFAPTECEEIALAVTELASNLTKHAGGGEIRLLVIEGDGRVGIQIESEDNGPGISDVERAVTDGYSTAGSLGTGLGTVNRLMDELEFRPRAHRAGLHIVCQRWLRPNLKNFRLRSLEFGAATRAYRMLPENGDAIILRQWEGHALTGVIDGLGHGHFAKKAAQTARQYIEQHFDQPLASLFRGAGRTCRATRGVVMALARFDIARETLAVANVGNVEVRLIGGPERPNLVVRRGILGLNAPNPVLTEHPWTSSSILIVHSDGLRTHWHWDEFQGLAHEPPGMIALQLLRKLGKIDDDATVVVAKGVKP